MADTKDLLAQASAALDAERLASANQIDSLTGANIALQAQLDTANSTIAGLKATIDQQSAQITALLAANDPWAAVDKTGTTDVTDKVQALLDKGLAMPAGKYLIDAVKGIKVKGAAKLDPQAILAVKPNGAPKYCAVDVLGSIEGGQVIGDRDSHDYTTAPGTHEWGYGLKLRTGAKASNVQVSKCTGDGVGVMGDNVEMRNVKSTGNRRQAMSVFACTGLRAYDCEFSGTSGAPNGPCAGVDFEPDSGSITDARLERCTSRNNRAGFLGWVRAEVAGNVDVTLVDCVTENNANGVQAAGFNGKPSIKVQGGTHSNRSANVRAETGSTITVDGGTFALIGKTRTPFTLTGTDTRTKYDIQTPTSTSTGLKGKAVVGTNSYV